MSSGRVFEAGTGLAFLAIVIGYLPVLYQLFSRRETHIIMLDARAGSPPNATTLLSRHGRRDSMHALDELLHPPFRQFCQLVPKRWLPKHPHYPQNPLPNPGSAYIAGFAYGFWRHRLRFSILDFSMFAGPYAAAMLAEMDARVIKIDATPEREQTISTGGGMALIHLKNYAGKEAIQVNLQSPEGQQIVPRCEQGAD